MIDNGWWLWCSLGTVWGWASRSSKWHLTKFSGEVVATVLQIVLNVVNAALAYMKLYVLRIHKFFYMRNTHTK
jgi:hypothetical protein